MTAPVLLVFYASRMPEARRSRGTWRPCRGVRGRFLVGAGRHRRGAGGRPNDADPSVPLVVAVIDGVTPRRRSGTCAIDRLHPAGPGRPAADRQRHRRPAPARHLGAEGEDTGAGRRQKRPEYRRMRDALGESGIERRRREYQKVVDANLPPDAEAAAGLRDGAGCLAAHRRADRSAAGPGWRQRQPDDVDAQTSGRRLPTCTSRHTRRRRLQLGSSSTLVRRTVRGTNRDRAREHLLDLFGAVGNNDDRNSAPGVGRTITPPLF